MSPARAFLSALSFLTRFPLRSRDASARHLGASLTFFPVVGALIGALLMASAYLLRGHLSSTMIAVWLVAELALVTGGLHLDGVSDLFDGLAGGRGDRDRALSIMRDPRIGALGAAAMLLVVLAKVAAVRDVLDAGRLLALCAFPAVARFCAVVLVVAFPYARADGLGRVFHEQARVGHLLLAALLTLPLVVSLSVHGAIAGAAALLAALGLALWATRSLGGITGDVCGAAIEIAEVAYLIAAVWK